MRSYPYAWHTGCAAHTADLKTDRYLVGLEALESSQFHAYTHGFIGNKLGTDNGRVALVINPAQRSRTWSRVPVRIAEHTEHRATRSDEVSMWAPQ